MTKIISLIVSIILSGFLVFFAWYSLFAVAFVGNKLPYQSIAIALLIGAVIFIVHAIKNFRSKP